MRQLSRLFKSALHAARVNPVSALFFFILCASLAFHIAHRTTHFPECDSTLPYKVVREFPRSGLTYSTLVLPSGSGQQSGVLVDKILSFGIVGDVLRKVAPNVPSETIRKYLSESSFVSLGRMGFVVAVDRAHLPYVLKSAFVLPLATTYSFGAGLLYGMGTSAHILY